VEGRTQAACGCRQKVPKFNRSQATQVFGLTKHERLEFDWPAQEVPALLGVRGNIDRPSKSNGLCLFEAAKGAREVTADARAVLE
jgi:hypothetical protein